MVRDLFVALLRARLFFQQGLGDITFKFKVVGEFICVLHLSEMNIDSYVKGILPAGPTLLYLVSRPVWYSVIVISSSHQSIGTETAMKHLGQQLIAALAALSFASPNSAFVAPKSSLCQSSSLSSTAASSTPASPWFTDSSNDSKSKLKTQILQLGAALDRGQSYNPTSGSYYESSMEVARSKIQSLIALADSENVPTSLEDIAGEWELVFTTVKHGIFRSSPFFLAVQEAFEYAEEKEVRALRHCFYFMRTRRS
jgi:hypothetical protein